MHQKYDFKLLPVYLKLTLRHAGNLNNNNSGLSELLSELLNTLKLHFTLLLIYHIHVKTTI